MRGHDAVGGRAERAAAILLLLATASCGFPVLAAASITVRADAGLQGLCRPGRWTPVRITVETAAQGLAGEISVDWGTSRVRRAVVLAPNERRQVELYVRTSEVGGTIAVRVRSQDAELQAVDLPVRVARVDEVVTLCVAGANAVGVGGDDCGALMTPESLPRSIRGYDAVDRIVWQPGAELQLAPDQRTAIDQWQALSALDSSGALAAVPQLPSVVPGLVRRHRTPRVVIAATGIYLGILLTLPLIVPAVRARGLVLFAAIAAVVAGGCGAALAAGRVGPASFITVLQTSIVQQLPGAIGSQVQMRAVAEFPSFGAFTLRPAVADSGIERPSRSGDRWEQTIDDGGYPVLEGIFGMRARQAFRVEAVTDLQPLQVDRKGRLVRVSNVSRVDLQLCRFPQGFSREHVAVLGPGQSVDAEEIERTDGAIFTCSMSDTPIAFTHAGRAVRVGGTALVAVSLDPQEPSRRP